MSRISNVYVYTMYKNIFQETEQVCPIDSWLT